MAPPPPAAAVSIVGGGSKATSQLYSFSSNGNPIPISRSNTSREGRANQRWENHSDGLSLLRLTTGTVPITNDGRILFISSGRKREWILPKGGWESDERMEESAVRETYEEAGILGTLGPRLSEITFETRKGKKRRMEREQQEEEKERMKALATKSNEDATSRKKPDKPWSTTSSCGASSEEDRGVSPSPINNVAFKTDATTSGLHQYGSDSSAAPPKTISEKKYAGICKMTLFPLYITEVLENWPENGRSRKIFSIEEALEVVTREEVRTALKEVKSKGLHLVSNNPVDVKK